MATRTGKVTARCSNWGYNDRNELTATDRFTGTGANSPGGVGGLHATYDIGLSKAYIYFHDGNGNVTSSGGKYAATNRMRFSSKPPQQRIWFATWFVLNAVGAANDRPRSLQ